MSEIKRIYYRAGGRSLEIAEEELARWQGYMADMRALRDELGADGLVMYGDRCGGLGFPEGVEPPEDWIRIKSLSRAWKPRGNRKSTRGVRNRMALKRKPRETITRRLFGDSWVFMGKFGNRVPYVYCEKVGDVMVLTVPETDPPKIPEGATLLKMSEYWKLKEDAESRAE